ncbi:hypothetical protein P175DRAFT_0517573 [Aspergillus ochraceoroseus IBT 24754]|uniref:Ima1 N-terminal domain-containing protein n=2 Tax=Aspergillus ochraceoroseus TaxID=138278 RepID=A0A2T5LSL3_9EURO|nr:uncharacterized protein P175DRAFT_0517573 [Aspergillus ochraceoroseus IBT 24754]KKK14529.1 hypothetical protein AOCH_004727 [Aspergillus ochraceoroseus]PTU19272.1 hypothetical protein P175DRAFT_0517573 [Aspergillus ochraceoroseus IBT 24754]
MAPLFSKRLSCFYCGRRSSQAHKGSVRRWCCPQCEAVNYLDENGDITDPPAAETNPGAQTPGPSSPFESTNLGLAGSGLFCAQCVRNQHLFTSALASYYPSADDPNYGAYERGYPKFRKNLEERYPQVCDKCEPRVKARIRQAGYEAKSDHLRRMMDRSKAGRVARQARQWNWRSLLVFTGALGYWASVAGQLSWDLTSALSVQEPLRDPDDPQVLDSVAACLQQTILTHRIPAYCALDLAPYAGLSLVVGILSLWYNPKLRLRVEGRGGRFLGLSEYYKAQLIVLVVRCAFWGVLRDSSSSGLDPNLPPALHIFMAVFTILSVVISRRIVRYDTRPLVLWSENTPTTTPMRRTEKSPLQTTGGKQPFFTPHESLSQTTPRFPLEKLATPRSAQEKRSIPTPPPEVDDMDWTPSVQHDFRPNQTIHRRDQKSILEGPMPFHGSLPPAPQPPSWNLRNRPSQRQKPIEQVVERNPFHRSPAEPSSSWTHNPGSPETAFAPPKFFPASDHVASTGLENLFDRTFTIKSPEDEEDTWQQSQHAASKARPKPSPRVQEALLFQYLRLGLLLVSLLAWSLSQYEQFSVPGNYVEVASLGSASLIAGFALLEALKQPIAQWNGMDILVSFAELVAAVHLGGHLPRASFERHYFDRYGKLLLIFMAVQEVLGLLAFYRTVPTVGASSSQGQHRSRPPSSGGSRSGASPRSRGNQQSDLQSFASSPSTPGPPALSFSSTALGSSFSTQPPEPQYQLPYSSYDGMFHKDHSFSLTSLKGNESDASDPLDRDSDTETTVTTATTATNNTIRNIRYGRNSNVNDTFFSPKRSELGPGIGGLSLDDRPTSRRMTRSQTQRLQANDGVRRRLR